MMVKFLSIIIPTFNQAWELEKTLYSLSRQIGMEYKDYEILLMNLNPDDLYTYSVAGSYAAKCKNLRLIQIHDEKVNTIKNSTFGLNLGSRQYAKGEILLLVVDPARIPTPGVVRKTRDCFERFGNEIVTTTIPYHFLKHSNTPGFTVKECREAFMKTRWQKDIYCLMDYAADTNISISGVPNESTWLGVSRDNFLKIGGHNEKIFNIWSEFNLDLWRRLTRSKPKDNLQIVGQANDHWGNKIGLGLSIHILDGEADFHLHHSGTSSRNTGALVRKRIECWKYYEKMKECIIVNLDNPQWGMGKSEEIFF